MRHLFCLLVIALFYSCSAQTQIVGKYAGENIPESFQLSSDSTFKYEYKAYHAYLYSTGKWKKEKGNFITLNSNIQNGVIPISVEKADIKNSTKDDILSIKFRSKEEIDIANYKCEVFINDTLYSEIKDGYLLSSGLSIETANKEINIDNLWFRYIRCDSLSLLKVKTQIRSIYFKVIKSPRVVTSTYFSPLALITEKALPQREDAAALVIGIDIDDSLFSYKIFINERVKVKGNKILLFNQNTSKWEEIPRVADTTNIFIR